MIKTLVDPLSETFMEKQRDLHRNLYIDLELEG